MRFRRMRRGRGRGRAMIGRSTPGLAGTDSGTILYLVEVFDFNAMPKSRLAG